MSEPHHKALQQTRLSGVCLSWRFVRADALERYVPDALTSRNCSRRFRPGKRYSFSVWAKPDQAFGFGLIYTAVQSHGGMDVGIPTGPRFFLFSDIDESQRRLTDAGFPDVEFVTAPHTWYLSSAEELMAAIMNGTLRAAAMLRGQVDLALENIKTMVAKKLVEYSDGGRFNIPMPALVASAAKP